MTDLPVDLLEEDDMRHPAYHLRTNKAVDRLLLVDVLRNFGRDCRDSTYYSFGGPFLEDLRIMDHFFPEMALVSLESDTQTFERQKFNKFSRRLTLNWTTMAKFLLHKNDENGYHPKPKDVIWLDYTDLDPKRLVEFQILLQAVVAPSIVRITLNAGPDVYIPPLKDKFSVDELERLQQDLADSFNKRFGVFLAKPVEPALFATPSKFPQLVQEMIRVAASQALDTVGSKVEFLPIQSTRYSDGTPMLSVTGVVCDRTRKKALLRTLRNVRFPNFDWHAPDHLDIPALSMKERLHLEPHLPIDPKLGDKAGELLFEVLNYSFDNSRPKTEKQLLHYADCQRDYPTFIRVY